MGLCGGTIVLIAVLITLAATQSIPLAALVALVLIAYFQKGED